MFRCRFCLRLVCSPLSHSSGHANLELEKEDGRAIVRIDSDGRTATSSWYEIWEAVNAVAYMCSTPAARHGGKAAKIGKDWLLFF